MKSIIMHGKLILRLILILIFCNISPSLSSQAPQKELSNYNSPISVCEVIDSMDCNNWDKIRNIVRESDFDAMKLLPSTDDIKITSYQASQNNPNAFFKLANYFYTGLGITYNIDKAIKWYTKASNAGLSEATLTLADCYIQGIGVNKDYSMAFSLISSIAHNNSLARYRMAIFYEKGIGGVVQNVDLAKRIYKEVVDSIEHEALTGNPIAQNYLGNMYYYGRGVRQNIEQALEYYRMSAEGAYATSASRLGYAYLIGEGVEQNFELAVKYYLFAATLGDNVAMYTLGQCYDAGRGVDVCPRKHFTGI